MYHPRFSGSHYAMGCKMGAVFKKNKVRFPIKLDPFQLRHGRACSALLQNHFPEVAEEIQGVTDTIGIDNTLFTSWMMCMGSCLDIRDGGSVEVRGCTAFSLMLRNQVLYGRNNDLPLFLKAISKSVYYRPDDGHRFILNTSSFINGEEGINDCGLVAAMTFVLPRKNDIHPGINSVFLVRYILEKCSTVDEGLSALRYLPIASSCNILLTDKGGNMAVAECHPLKIHVRYPEKNIDGGPFIITVNHFTSEEMRPHDASDRNVYGSMERYETVRKALVKVGGSDGGAYAKDILSGKYGFICQYPKQANFDTIWSSFFDVTSGRVFRAEGNPSRTGFKEDQRMRKSAQKDL